MQKFRFFLGLWSAKFLLTILKLLGKEKDDKPGLLAYRFCDDFISYINKPKTVIGVTGTNGKTTVSNMVADFLRLDGKKVAYNDWGANALAGQTRCLLDAVNIFNKPKKDVAVLEIDEVTSNYTLKRIKPNYIIITNLFRDSIKRNAYISYVKEHLEEGISSCDAQLIINADDPILNTLNVKNKTVYYGVSKINEAKEIPWNTDFPICPKCHKKIKYKYWHYRHIGNVSCDCGFKSKKADVLADNINYKNMTFEYTYNKEKSTIKMLSPNLFNVFNVTSVVALFRTMGYKKEIIEKYISKIHMPSTRENFASDGNMKFDLQVAKGQNGSSLSTVADRLKDTKEDTLAIVMLDEESCKKDKSETVTWIYETDFTSFASKNIKRIIVCSYLYQDYKVAMMLNGVNEEKIICVDSEQKILDKVSFDNIKRVVILFDVENITRPRLLRNEIRNKYLKGEEKNEN